MHGVCCIFELNTESLILNIRTRYDIWRRGWDTQYGRLQELKPETDSIKAYFERVLLYFTANEVQDEKKVPILLSSIGASTYALLSDLLAPDSPGDKSLDDISTTLKAHFEPQRSVITERFHFHKREQAPGESIAEFDAALRKLATHCEFKDNLQDSLRDRFVCGLRGEAMQRRLLSESKLTYKGALSIAKGTEAAAKDTKAFQIGDPHIKTIPRDNPPPKQGKFPPCYRCGRCNHRSDVCKFKDATCHACGKTGHIAPVCHSKSKKEPKDNSRCGKPKYSKSHYVEEEQDIVEPSSSEDEFEFHKV